MVPQQYSHGLQEGGSKRLETLLRGEEEEATPEFMRQRPKYYYYHEWMRKRIAEHCGGSLPEAVIGRMLAMEAGELDLILHYPSAAQQQARMSRVLYVALHTFTHGIDKQPLHPSSFARQYPDKNILFCNGYVSSS